MADTCCQLYQKLKALKVRVVNNTTHAYVILPDIIDASVTLKRNEPLSWNIQLANYNRQYTRGVSASPYSSYMEATDNFLWEIYCAVEGGDGTVETKTFTHLPLLNYGFKGSSTGGWDVGVSGTDYSYKLTQDNQTMQTWRSQSASLKYARYIVGAICTNFNVSSLLSFDDYLIKLLHFQGAMPLDIIRQILAVKFADWRMSGTTFQAYQPLMKASPTAPDWIVTDRDSITDFEYGVNRGGIATRIIVRKTEETSKIAFEEETNNTVEHSVNINDTFPDGCVNLDIRWSAVYGDIKQIYVWTGADKTGDGFLYSSGSSGGSAIKSVSFYFQPTAGISSELLAQVYYHIVGKGNYPLGTIEDLSDFTVKYQNLTLESYFNDYRPTPDLVINSLLPSKSAAETYAQRYLEEAARKFEIVKYTQGLNINMAPGDTVQLSYYGANIKDTRFFVEEVTHNFVAGTSQVTATKYRTDTIGSYTDPVNPTPITPYI